LLFRENSLILPVKSAAIGGLHILYIRYCVKVQLKCS
jgi:hypothetical protein